MHILSYKNWKIRENDTERYFILDLNAIPCYRIVLKKIDWANPNQARRSNLDPGIYLDNFGTKTGAIVKTGARKGKNKNQIEIRAGFILIL